MCKKIDKNANDDDDDDGVLRWGPTRPLAIPQTESLSVRRDLTRQHTQNLTQTHIYTYIEMPDCISNGR